MSAAIQDRLVSVEGKHPDAELELGGRSGELCECLQARRGRFVVGPQRVVAELLQRTARSRASPASRPAVMPSPRRIGVEVFMCLVIFFFFFFFGHFGAFAIDLTYKAGEAKHDEKRQR